MTYRVVWFKRDLRVHDHAPLAEAARLGPVLCLYVLEPELWRQPDAARQHFAFVQESLKDLSADLRRLGARDRTIVQLRFYDGLTQREIGERIGVTQMQVSRLISRILRQLREEVVGPPTQVA